MRYVVTGASGLVGRAVSELIRRESGDALFLSRREGEGYTKTSYSHEELLSLLREGDIVLHLAAERPGPKGLTEEAAEKTRECFHHVMEAAIEKKASRFIYASSISVYDEDAALPWAEDAGKRDKSLYVREKLYAEETISRVNRAVLLPCTALRFAHIYGEGEKNNYMINVFLRRAFHGLPLILHAPSRARREMLYVRDAAKALLFFASSGRTGVFNIGSGEALTNEEIAERITEAFSIEEGPIIQDETAEEGIHSSYMNLRKAKEACFLAEYNMRKALPVIRKEMETRDDIPLLYETSS